MSKSYPMIPLGDLLVRSEELAEIDISKQYRQVTVKLWGKGVVLRDIVDGSSISSASRQFIVRAKQFILSKIDARNGAFGLIPDTLDGAIVSSDFPVFTPNNSCILPEFLEWMSKTQDFVQLCIAASEGTTNRVRLKVDRFLSTAIPLPSLEEQSRIIARIEALAAKIEEARRLRREAVEEAETAHSCIVSSLEFAKKDWTTVQSAILDKKGSVRSGPFGSQLHHEEFVESGIAAIGTRDVQVNQFKLNSGWYVDPEKFEEFRRYQVFPGDVLGTIVGASIGRFCVVPEDIPLAFTTKHIMALTLDKSKALPHFVSYMLNFHSRSRNSLFAQCEGSAQPSLNSYKILNTELPLPSLEKQLRIISYLDASFAKIKDLKQLQVKAIAELDALLPSILDRAFKGEL